MVSGGALRRQSLGSAILPISAAINGSGTISDVSLSARADIEAIVDAITSVIGSAPRPVQLHEPYFAGKEWEYVKSCIDDGWVSSAGSFVPAFEERLAAICGTRAAVATVNGTAALHVALKIAGVRADDEVVMPALTFVATANAVSYCGAVPHFVDAEIKSLGVDVKRLSEYLQTIVDLDNGVAINRETGRAIKACVPVHVLGHPVDMDALNRVCAPLNIVVIEDATESLGSLYHGHPCGGLGHIGVLSFNGNKIVTTGGGGALVTNDLELAARAKHLTKTAKLPHLWEFVHDQIGWNYRLPNINAALGMAQLESLDTFVAAKRSLAARYAEAFREVAGISFVAEPKGAASNYWLNAVLLEEDNAAARNEVLEATHAAGFFTRPAWTPMHQLGMYKAAPRTELSVTESIRRRLITLPSSAILGMA